MTMRCRRFSLALSALALFGLAAAAHAVDLTVAPFWDGETTQTNPLLNRYGGAANVFNVNLQRTTSNVHSGNAAYQVDSSVTNGGFGFFQNVLGPGGASVVSRDIGRFDEARFWLNNTTGSAFTLKYEIKDYRDSNSHKAERFFNVPAAAGWQQYTAPLNLADPGWTVSGSPDLERARLVSYVIEADQGQAVNGDLFFDNVSFVEPGGPVDTQTASLNDMVEVLARRQFEGLWGSRNRDNGIDPAAQHERGQRRAQRHQRGAQGPAPCGAAGLGRPGRRRQLCTDPG